VDDYKKQMMDTDNCLVNYLHPSSVK